MAGKKDKSQAPTPPHTSAQILQAVSVKLKEKGTICPLH